MNFQICVCTRQRPKTLAICLNSLINQTFVKEHSYSILVVENDNKSSSEQIISSIREKTSIPIIYIKEPVIGIAHARNCALDHSKEADAVIFIDDDESASQDWLKQLLQCAGKHEFNSIIYGHVISLFPPDTPSYLYPFIQRKEHASDQRLSTCASNNVWIPTKLITRLALRFDVNATTGDDDTRFFLEATHKGAFIYSCPDAKVNELIPASRVSIEWIAKRHYRLGMGRMQRTVKNKKKRGQRALKTLIKLFTGVLSLLSPKCITDKTRRAKQCFKICNSTGALAALLGISYNAYKKPDGQ